jgi:hypothetical protein
MDEKSFKKHLQDLVDGRHHPEEHDWSDASGRTAPKRKPARKRAAAKRPRTAK